MSQLYTAFAQALLTNTLADSHPGASAPELWVKVGLVLDTYTFDPAHSREDVLPHLAEGLEASAYVSTPVWFGQTGPGGPADRLRHNGAQMELAGGGLQYQLLNDTLVANEDANPGEVIHQQPGPEREGYGGGFFTGPGGAWTPGLHIKAVVVRKYTVEEINEEIRYTPVWTAEDSPLAGWPLFYLDEESYPLPAVTQGGAVDILTGEPGYEDPGYSDGATRQAGAIPTGYPLVELG